MKDLSLNKPAKRHSKLKRFLVVLLCVFAALILIAFLPALVWQKNACVYDDSLLGLSQETIASSWVRIYHRENDSSIGFESTCYQLWQRNDEQMVAVFRNGELCDYLILNLKDGSLHGSVEAGFKALPTLLQLRFGVKPGNTHHYDVGSGASIDSWLTSDGRVVVWSDSFEIMVHDVFTMANADEFVLLVALNTLVHLPYILSMVTWHSLSH